jgi:hypothetical protein
VASRVSVPLRSILGSAERLLSVAANPVPAHRHRRLTELPPITRRAEGAKGEAFNRERKAGTMRTPIFVKVIAGTVLYLAVQLMALHLLARTLVSGLFGLP